MSPDTPRIYLTLRCNLKCSYCSNGKQIGEYEELGWEDWRARIDAMGGNEVVFTGGEPTLHPDFYMLLHALSGRYTMHIYSNFAVPLDVGSLPAHGDIRWRASCHARTRADAEQWVANVRQAHDLRQSVTATTVKPPDEVLDVLRPHGICVDPMQHYPPKLAPPVRCTLRRRFYAPDGTRYHCVGKLVRKDESGIVADAAGPTVTCMTPDRCARCDSLSTQRVVLEAPEEIPSE